MRESMPRFSKKGYLTSQEAARALGVSLRTVQLWVEDGSLDVTKSDGSRRITQESVIQLLSKRKVEFDKLVSAPTRKLRVMVVEDEQVQVMMYQLRFEKWGLPVELDTVNDAFEAITRISNRAPDVLIMDLNLPGMDGFQMMKTLTNMQAASAMKIVVVTSLTKEDIAAEGGLPETVNVFYKPVPFHILETMMKDLVAGLAQSENPGKH